MKFPALEKKKKKKKKKIAQRNFLPSDADFIKSCYILLTLTSLLSSMISREIALLQVPDEINNKNYEGKKINCNLRNFTLLFIVEVGFFFLPHCQSHEISSLEQFR